MQFGMLIVVALVCAAMATGLSIFLFTPLRSRWYKVGYRANTFYRVLVFSVTSLMGAGIGSASGAGIRLAFSDAPVVIGAQVVGMLLFDFGLLASIVKANSSHRSAPKKPSEEVASV